jgi:hypothetical protein
LTSSSSSSRLTCALWDVLTVTLGNLEPSHLLTYANEPSGNCGEPSHVAQTTSRLRDVVAVSSYNHSPCTSLRSIHHFEELNPCDLVLRKAEKCSVEAVSPRHTSALCTPPPPKGTINTSVWVPLPVVPHTKPSVRALFVL